VTLGELGDVDLQHQQGHDDREHAVGQGEHAGRIVEALQQGSFIKLPLLGHVVLPP